MKLEGNKGKSFNDRVLAGEVRTLTLNAIKKYLVGDDEDFKKQLLLRLSGSILPRLNEITGADGEALPTPILNVYGNKE